MTTNFNTSNDVDESNRNSSIMDVDKPGIVNEEDHGPSLQ